MYTISFSECYKNNDRSSDASENIESGDESTERSIDHHLHELLTAWQPSLHSGS